jgi:hypothetical protein
MGKVFTSLIVLLLVLAIAPAAAWANSIVLGSSNINRLHMAINRTGTGSSSWNEFQMQFNGSLLQGSITGNGGAWTFSGNKNSLTGFGPANWHSTLNLTFGLRPMTGNSFYIDVLQFSNGALLSGASTRLAWNGVRWTASGLPPIRAPEPSILVLAGLTTLVGVFVRKRLL